MVTYFFLAFPGLSVCEDPSSSGDSKTEEEEKRSPKEKDRTDKDKEDGEFLCLILENIDISKCIGYWVLIH